MSHVILDYDGEASACEAIRQFARDYDWGSERIEDPDYAANEAIERLTEEIPDLLDARYSNWEPCATESERDDALDILRGELVASAEAQQRRWDSADEARP